MTVTTARTTALTVMPSANEKANIATAAEQLAVIHAQLDQHFVAHSANTINTSSAASLTQLASLLSQYCHLPNIIILLSAIIQAPELLASIAARSYWHGNGFLKIVLIDKGYKLRLHIWFAGTSCEENIHSHRWGFASHVLTGTLKSELWTDAANDDVHHNMTVLDESCASSQLHEPTMPLPNSLQAREYLYTAKHQRGQYTIAAHKQLIGTAHLEKLQNVAQTAGASYVMTPHQLHRINHPGQELVATVICTAPTQVLTNRLFPTIPDPKLQPAYLSAAELQQALMQYLQQAA